MKLPKMVRVPRGQAGSRDNVADIATSRLRGAPAWLLPGFTRSESNLSPSDQGYQQKGNDRACQREADLH
jgi:hypothetical protein